MAGECYGKEDLRRLTLVAVKLAEPDPQKPAWLHSQQVKDLREELNRPSRKITKHQRRRLKRLMDGLTVEQIIFMLNKDDERYFCLKVPPKFVTQPIKRK